MYEGCYKIETASIDWDRRRFELRTSGGLRYVLSYNRTVGATKRENRHYFYIVAGIAKRQSMAKRGLTLSDEVVEVLLEVAERAQLKSGRTPTKRRKAGRISVGSFPQYWTRLWRNKDKRHYTILHKVQPDEVPADISEEEERLILDQFYRYEDGLYFVVAPEFRVLGLDVDTTTNVFASKTSMSDEELVRLGELFRNRLLQETDLSKLQVLGRPVADLAELYQELPLLREVKREELPQERKSSDTGYPDIHGWEEEILTQPETTYEPVELETLFTQFRTVIKEARSDVPRLVLLGPPGSGKTTLCQWLAWRAAKDDLFGQRLVPAQVRLGEWERWAGTRQQFDLAEYLARQHPGPRREHWARWLERGDVLLLLDGLDEIKLKSAFLHSLKRLIGESNRCPIVLTSRTVSRERHEIVCPELPVFMQGTLPAEKRNAYIERFLPERSFDRKALAEQLDRTPQMVMLAANPLLLSIICYVAQDGAALPSTRSELYERALKKLLAREPQRVDIDYDEPDHEDKLAILERLALELMVRDSSSRVYPARFFNNTLRSAIKSEIGVHVLGIETSLREDLVHNSGLLRRDSTRGYFFLHLTMQEFLAAAALGRLINESPHRWDATIQIGERQRTLRRLVDAKAWDPAWQEVICMLAGRLQDPTLLLEMLVNPEPTMTNPHGDDVFRHRLALAALCLPEITSGTRAVERVDELVDSVTAAAFSTWWDYNEQQELDTANLGIKWNPAELMTHFDRAVPAFGATNGRLCQRTVSFFAALASIMHSNFLYSKLSQSNCAANALHAFHDLQDKSESALDRFKLSMAQLRIADWLCISQDPTRLEYLGLTGGGRPAWARPTPRLTPQRAYRILRWLREKNDKGIQAAMRAIQLLPQISPPLADALCYILRGLVFIGTDDTSRSHLPTSIRAVAQALAKKAREPLPSGFVHVLADRLCADDHHQALAAAQAIAHLGLQDMIPDIVEAARRLLHSTDEAVVTAACDVMRSLGHAAHTSKAKARLYELLSYESEEVRQAAARTLRTFGEDKQVGTDDGVDLRFIAELEQSLRARDENTWRQAAETVKNLGSLALTPLVLDGLVRLVRSEQEESRKMGLDVIKLLCSGARIERRTRPGTVRRRGSLDVTPRLLANVTSLLQSDRKDLREAGLSMVELLDDATVQQEFLEQLYLLTRHEQESTRFAAAQACGILGTAVKELLDSEDVHIRSEVMTGYKQTHANLLTAAPDILERIEQWSEAEEWDAASFAIWMIGGPAARPRIVRQICKALEADQPENRLLVSTAAIALWVSATPPDLLPYLPRALQACPIWEYVAIGALPANGEGDIAVQSRLSFLHMMHEWAKDDSEALSETLQLVARFERSDPREYRELALRLMRDNRLEAQAVGLQVLQQRGPTAVSTDLKDAILHLMPLAGAVASDSRWPATEQEKIENFALETLRILGHAALHERLATRLKELLDEERTPARAEAGRVISTLMAQGVRFFADGERWKPRLVSSLSSHTN